MPGFKPQQSASASIFPCSGAWPCRVPPGRHASHRTPQGSPPPCHPQLTDTSTMNTFVAVVPGVSACPRATRACECLRQEEPRSGTAAIGRQAVTMKAIVVLLVLSTIAGCGMVTHGTSQSILCQTTPAGALVRSADGSTCSAPCIVSLKRKKDDVLTIERKGYETVTLPVHSVVWGASAGAPGLGRGSKWSIGC
jgi:hypothetical protein